jgi:hypothetical protein
METMTRPGPGRFEGNESLEVSEYLDEMAGISLFDDQVGEVDTFGWYALFTDVDKDPLDHWPNNPDLKPAYIVDVDGNGFFSYRGFELNTQARRAWQDITQEYLAEMVDDERVLVL